MRILPDHFLKEFLGPFLSSLAGFLLLFLLGRGLVQMADFIFNKSVDVSIVVQLVFYSLPFMLIFLIPMSVLIGALLAFRKLSVDNEITAARANGINLANGLAPIFIFTLMICLFSFVLSDQIASTSHYNYRRLLMRVGIENPSAALEEGTFVKTFKNFVIFIYEIDKNKLKGVRIYQPQEGKPTRTIIAQKGELISIPEKGVIKLKLIHGTSDEPDPKDPAKLYKLNFKTYELPLNLSDATEPEELGKKPKDMTVRELRNEIERLGEAGIRATYPLSTEIHNKIALALSSLTFLLVGIPLGITTRRSERPFTFGIALVLMTVYWLLLIGGKALAQKGVAPPFLALQCANFVVGGLGAFLFLKVVKN